MSRFGLIGADYESQSPAASPATLLNWYYESMEDLSSKSSATLYATPGLRKVWTLAGGGALRALYEQLGRVFAICGTNFYELLNGQPPVLRGTVANDSKPAYITGSPQQLLVASALIPYVYDLTANTLTQIQPNVLVNNIAQVEFLDGFFIALVANSAQIFASAPLDATTWPGDSTSIVNVFTGNVDAIIMTHRQLVLFGDRQSTSYYDAGTAPFPLAVVDGSFVETGIEAPASRVNLDNSVFWLGGDERGKAIAWRANGYTPQRVSNYAVEFAWNGYATVADAVGYTYQEAGHTFWVLWFPTANKTWVYDVGTGTWHQRAYWNKLTGKYEAHHSCCHAFAFEKHLVGDWSSPSIYEMSIGFYDDNGNEIQRIRRTGPIGVENDWLRHKKLEIYLETGLGPIPAFENADGSPRGPQIMIRWSDTNGKRWSNQHFRDCGQGGEFKTRITVNRLGRARNRVYEISVTDPVPWRIIDGFLLADPDFPPQKRLAKRFEEMT